MEGLRMAVNFFAFLAIFLASEVAGILSQTGSFVCTSDSDCNAQTTLLVCVRGQCSCVQGDVTYHGILMRFDMEWNALRSKCTSKHGSPCTFKDRWYPTEAGKLECSPDTACVPNSVGSDGRLQQQFPQQQQQQYLQGQQYSAQQYPPQGQLTRNDFGVCYGGGNRVGVAGNNGQFYPYLTNTPGRQEFANQGGNPYPYSPGGYDNSAGIWKISPSSAMFSAFFLFVFQQLI